MHAQQVVLSLRAGFHKVLQGRDFIVSFLGTSYTNYDSGIEFPLLEKRTQMMWCAGVQIVGRQRLVVQIHSNVTVGKRSGCMCSRMQSHPVSFTNYN
jgi:hypothetical protein